MKRPLIEACVDSYASAMAASRAGADRLELCAHLVIGGTTPTHALFRQVQRDSGVPINVLIRPRFGDFLYTEPELEEMCEELRKRPGRNGSVKECTVQKYLETVSSVLEDAKKNDIIPFNPAHRVRKKCAEKEKQHIPQKYEMQRLLKTIMDEPILYKAYYTMAIATGLRRGELCALRWEDITGPYEFTIRHSRSYVAGQGIVESDTKNHRERVIVIPAQVWEFLMSLRHWQTIRSGKPDNSQPIFTDLDGHVPNPDTFTRHLRRLYAKNGFPKEYHLHTLRHYYATYLLQEGTSKQVATDLLGHADTAFLERTYCHPQNMAKREVANLMESLLSPKNICYQPFKWVLKGKKVG